MSGEANGPRLRVIGVLVAAILGLVAGRQIAACSCEGVAWAGERDPLALALESVPTSARRTGVLQADRLVALARGCTNVYPETLLALAWVESGFRPGVIRGDTGQASAGGLTMWLEPVDGLPPPRPRMKGLFQINERFIPAGVDPLDPDQAFPLVCRKLRRWGDHHRRHCLDTHSVLSHHFGGNVPSKRASISADKVRARASILVSLADRL